MGSGGGPHGDGVVVLYQNVKVAITDGKITVSVDVPNQTPDVVHVINQRTGAIES